MRLYRFKILLTPHFSGEALDWFLMSEFQDFTMFESEFLKFYWSTAKQQSLLAELIGPANNYFRSNKSLCAFALHMRQRNSYLDEPIPISTLIQIIIRKLPREIQIALSHPNIISWVDLETRLQQLQPIFRSYNSQQYNQPQNNTAGTEGTTHRPYGGNYSRGRGGGNLQQNFFRQRSNYSENTRNGSKFDDSGHDSTDNVNNSNNSSSNNNFNFNNNTNTNYRNDERNSENTRPNAPRFRNF